MTCSAYTARSWSPTSPEPEDDRCVNCGDPKRSHAGEERHLTDREAIDLLNEIRGDERQRLADLLEENTLALVRWVKSPEAMLGMVILLLRLDDDGGQQMIARLDEGDPDDSLAVLRDLVHGSEDCSYDHHGLCQAHHLDPKPCPYERAKKRLSDAGMGAKSRDIEAPSHPGSDAREAAS